jgi:hypothetical protein
MVTIGIVPFVSADGANSEVTVATDVFDVFPMAAGVDGVLKQLPNKDIGVLIKIVAHQEVEYLALLERKAILAIVVAIAFDAVTINSSGKGEVTPPCGTGRQQGLAFMELALDQVQKTPEIVFHGRIIRAGCDDEMILRVSHRRTLEAIRG